MNYGLILDTRFADHLTPEGHPERPDRIRSIREALERWEHFGRLQKIEPVPAEEDWILGVHSSSHFERIRRTAGVSFDQLDPDTYTSPHSFDVAMLAAGSSVRLVELLLKSEIESGFLLARPPGHHAESSRAMGFCLFNHIALAAQWALQQEGIGKVAVVDFDVHHGNGTQEIFYARPDVLYISQHQYPWYPGTGEARETGQGAGEGFTVNFPIRAGIGGHFYCSLFRDLVSPILQQYAPDLILVSAGFDAHAEDPLGGMKLVEADFGELANILNKAARKLCQGRILYFLEGGYDLRALPQSVLTVISTTLSPQTFEIPPAQLVEYQAYRDQIGRILSAHWKI
ncbi:MAG: histone deacetylase family protein [Acidobacteriota bacterium]